MPKTIFVIEDDLDILSMIQFVLADEGYQVFTSTDGNNIYSRSNEIKPDLILMDIQLPEEDGRQLCRSLKEINNHPPIILMSAQADYRISGKACADDFIDKPFSIHDLLKRIKTQLARSA